MPGTSTRRRTVAHGGRLIPSIDYAPRPSGFHRHTRLPGNFVQAGPLNGGHPSTMTYRSVTRLSLGLLAVGITGTLRAQRPTLGPAARQFVAVDTSAVALTHV